MKTVLTILKKIAPACVLILLLIPFSLNAQSTTASDTIQIAGETIGIFIPSRQVAQQQIEQTGADLQSELRDYVRQMRSQDFISDNVVPTVDISLEDEAGVEALRVTYSYSLLNDTLKFQTDDFGLGNYRVDQSNALMVTLSLMRSNIEGILSRFFLQPKDVSIIITGSADAVPIRSALAYGGEYGPWIADDCIVDGVQRGMFVSTDQGISDNQTLAFVRSYAVRNYIKEQIEPLKASHVSFYHRANVSPYSGGRYRRVIIELVIHNVFDQAE